MKEMCYLPHRDHRDFEPANSYTYETHAESCSEADSRYEEIDTMPGSTFLDDILVDHTLDCTSCTNCDDYIDTGQKCGSTPFSDPDCMVYQETPQVTCGNTDTTCKNIM